MKDKDLDFNRKVHVIYSSACKRIIKEHIGMHYPKKEVNAIWEKVQLQYVEFLKNYRTDLGGKRNRMNKAGGTYDCIALFSYYKVCKDVVDFKEIEEINKDILLPAFRAFGFVNLNKRIYVKLFHNTLKMIKKIRDKFKDYDMVLEDYKEDEPIKYHFNTCPIYEFAKEHDLLDILPAICNADYKGVDIMGGKLIRTGTLKTSSRCDFTIVGNKDKLVEEHPEYVAEDGGIYNK